MLSYSRVLKLSLFATGLSGIVAEYVLATMATYFLGDSVFQWTIILSLMLFAMGLGSRFSKRIKTNLIERYILIELLLSFLTSFSALLVYIVMPYLYGLDVLIYILAVLVGCLIGMEIPLVTRINDNYEGLRSNISNVMENDYYGSLLGGLFFAFIGIKYLGLTYTPFIVGGVNLIVALGVLYKFKPLIHESFRKRIRLMSVGVIVLFALGLLFARPIVFFGNQARYSEKVIYNQQTPYQQITVTQQADNFQLYLNQGKQLSSFDEWMYHEPLIHPVMGLTKGDVDVLLMGAGDGCAIRELLKYDRVRSITLVDLDSVMIQTAKEHPIFRKLNQDAFLSQKVNVIISDAFNYLENTSSLFDVIIADFPDPRSIELNRLYTYEFYKLCGRKLRKNGVFITQATSPYYTTKTFRCIDKTLKKVGFNTIPLHNHVYTFGEWAWVIGSFQLTEPKMKQIIENIPVDALPLRWMNGNSLKLICNFGQDLVRIDTVDLDVNSIHNPVIYKYYEDGDWSYSF